jgi:hypothetical protein
MRRKYCDLTSSKHTQNLKCANLCVTVFPSKRLTQQLSERDTVFVKKKKKLYKVEVFPVSKYNITENTVGVAVKPIIKKKYCFPDNFQYRPSI